MGYGERVDAVVGKLSRLLHLRRTHTDTSHELTPYFGLPLDELLPEPTRLPEVPKAPPLKGERSTRTAAVCVTLAAPWMCEAVAVAGRPP